MTFNILFNLDGEEPKQHPQDVKNDLKKLLVGRARRKLDETGEKESICILIVVIRIFGWEPLRKRRRRKVLQKSSKQRRLVGLRGARGKQYR